MTRTARLFIGVIIAQVLILVGMAAGNELILSTDTRDVTLQTVPVDPRDLLRGDFVVLRYEISELRAAGLDVLLGEDIFVELVETGDGQWGAAAIDRAPRSDWQRFIRGTVVSKTDDRIELEYGIEAYFVPEGRGFEIETARDVDVVVALSDEGDAVIRHLIVDGDRWEP